MKIPTDSQMKLCAMFLFSVFRCRFSFMCWNRADTKCVSLSRFHRENAGTLGMVSHARSPLKGDIPNKYPRYKAYMGLIKGRWITWHRQNRIAWHRPVCLAMSLTSVGGSWGMRSKVRYHPTHPSPRYVIIPHHLPKQTRRLVRVQGQGKLSSYPPTPPQGAWVQVIRWPCC